MLVIIASTKALEAILEWVPCIQYLRKFGKNKETF